MNELNVAGDVVVIILVFILVVMILFGIINISHEFCTSKKISRSDKIAVFHLILCIIGVIAFITLSCLFLTAFNEKEFHVSQPVNWDIQGAPRTPHADVSIVHDSSSYDVQGTQRIYLEDGGEKVGYVQ